MEYEKRRVETLLALLWFNRPFMEVPHLLAGQNCLSSVKGVTPPEEIPGKVLRRGNADHFWPKRVSLSSGSASLGPKSRGHSRKCLTSTLLTYTSER